MAGSLTDMVIESQRRKHLAYLMADQGAIVNPDSAKNLPKQVRLCSISLLDWFSLVLTYMICIHFDQSLSAIKQKAFEKVSLLSVNFTLGRDRRG